MNEFDRRTAIKWMLAASAALQHAERVLRRGRRCDAGSEGLRHGSGPDEEVRRRPLAAHADSTARDGARAVRCDHPRGRRTRPPHRTSASSTSSTNGSARRTPTAGDRTIVLEGLTWLEAEAQRRFHATFVKLSATQMSAICDDMTARRQSPSSQDAAAFFMRYRALTAGGYYTTPVGMKT